MLIELEVATSVAIGTDALANHPERVANYDRIITAVACAGSAAAGDFNVEISAGTTRIAQIFNSATGFPTADHERRFVAKVPRGTPISAIVRDAANTNSAWLRIIGLP